MQYAGYFFLRVLLSLHLLVLWNSLQVCMLTKLLGTIDILEHSKSSFSLLPGASCVMKSVAAT